MYFYLEIFIFISLNVNTYNCNNWLNTLILTLGTSGFSVSLFPNSEESQMPFTEDISSLSFSQNKLQKYKCSYCIKTFHSLTLLIRHNRIHTGERPFVCKICQKAFTQSGNLNQHMRIHTGKKPFQCDFCDYSATQSVHLKRHMYSKHENITLN